MDRCLIFLCGINNSQTILKHWDNIEAVCYNQNQKVENIPWHDGTR